MAKAISTWLSDGCIFIVRLFEFIVFGNPLSMFVFNLLAPHKAAEFAHNKALFGEGILSFYEYYALQWPFFWARYWMKLEKIYQYPVDRQVKYFLKVAVKNSTEAATLKAMQKTRDDDTMFWPDAYETLFFKYGDTELPYEELRSHMVGECCVGHRANVTVIEFMMRNVRLSWYALQEVVKRAKINDDMRDELKKYLSKGRLNDSQFNILVDAVATEPGSGDLQMLGLVLDYIKSYGISEQQMSRIRSQYSQVFIELVEEKSRFYKQSKLVKSYRNTDQDKDAWRKMCKNLQPIFPEIQEKMSYEQYVIFHETGNELCIDAAKAFLNRPNKMLWRLMFANEQELCKTKEMQEFLCRNAAWKSQYKDIQRTLKKISKS